jgi:hypothetical protein
MFAAGLKSGGGAVVSASKRGFHVTGKRPRVPARIDDDDAQG